MKEARLCVELTDVASGKRSSVNAFFCSIQCRGRFLWMRCMLKYGLGCKETSENVREYP
jgi:hypothetical protein